MNRTFNCLTAILLLFLSLPVMMVSAIIIYFQLKTWPIFRQERGLTLSNGKFVIYKFRTLNHSNVEKTSRDNVFYKPELNEQVTGFTAFLRRTGLDELPQLINVIQGRMNIVGPRPLMFEDLKIMKEQNPELYNIREQIELLPGITGLWQLEGDRSKGAENLLKLDTLYYSNRSVLLDLKLIFKTLPVVLLKKHSDAIVNEDNQSNIVNKFAKLLTVYNHLS